MFEALDIFSILLVLGVVRQVQGGWVVFSETGKKLSRVYSSKKQAEDRLKQIELFKHQTKAGSK